ncbi:MAG: hypothetical protein HQL50_08035 [Magnetococcales bacterium]|nr:hypothetical protein [Magnetococcales bacterium]
MSETLYVTGANSRYFVMMCPLLMSFRLQSPETPLYVCDFGLTQAECRFLASLGILLPKPPDLPDDLHPYRYKAALHRFAEAKPYDTLVWIDADALITGPFVEKMEELIAEMEAQKTFIAVGQDSVGTIGDYTGKFQEKVRPFTEMLDQTTISPDSPYLNCAVFAVRSPGFLEQWDTMSRHIPTHLTFEQNVFNILAYTLFDRVSLLDKETWNVHDLDLDEAKLATNLADRPFHVTLRGKEVLVVHATSFKGRAITARIVEAPAGDRMLDGILKTAKNPDLAQLYEVMLVSWINQHRQQLERSGVLEESRPMK